MKYIATFDIGTTAVKGVLIDVNGAPAYSRSIGIETIYEDNFKEQRPNDWYEAFCAISKEFFAQGFAPDDITGIVMSGQMQDLIPVDKSGRPVCNAILYSDGRADEQAREIGKIIGLRNIAESTGNNFDGSLPFSKLLWIKQNQPNVFERIYKVLISSKDYVILKLTAFFVTDVTSASTSGLMDIHKKLWNDAWADAVGIDKAVLPKLLYADEKAGEVTNKASSETGYKAGTPVYAGTGDAGATTLASGITKDGEFNINLGTSGWVACVSSDILAKENVFNLAAMPRDSYINVVPFFNAGNVHKWISKTLTKDDEQNLKYDYVDRLLEKSVPGSNGLMFLPYLAGERFPVVDTGIRGGYYGISPETTKQDMARSCLEGVAFSIRQGIESIGRRPMKISMIGGGAQVRVWCQIFADVLNHEILVYKNAEFLPAVAIAAAALVGGGRIPDYHAFTDSLQKSDNCICYKPKAKSAELYDSIYSRYLSLYPAFKSIK